MGDNVQKRKGANGFGWTKNVSMLKKSKEDISYLGNCCCCNNL